MSELVLSPDTFRALARSAPWRFRSLHFTWRTPPDRAVECWLRRPGWLRVRGGGQDRVVTGDSSTGPQPVVRPDGFVADRPRAFTHEVDDPMWVNYWFVSMLDPEELSGDVALSGLRSERRDGRITWWARAVPEEGYEPRCACCPLLWSEVSDRWEHGDGEAGWEPPPGTVYPEAYEVGLDVETGIVVHLAPVGGSRQDLAFDTTIHAVDPPSALSW